jgi:hypothetical protein
MRAMHAKRGPCMNLRRHANGAFTLDVSSILNENLGGILGGTES